MLAWTILSVASVSSGSSGSSGSPAQPPPEVAARQIAAGFASPVELVSAQDGTGRLFVIDQIGLVRILRDGTLLPRPFLDVRNLMIPIDPRGDERGLLGLAFHPGFAENGRFFVKYSAPLRPEGPAGWDHTNVVAEFRVSPSDPDRADSTSERIVIAIDHPQSNHNSGELAFGHDGYLYLGEGDGGAGNDTGNGHNPDIGNGQDISVLLGKILRIDVDSELPYGIPPDNPFARPGPGRPEIYAWGFRNPYRFSFDPGGSRALLAADAGQDLWEEIDLVRLGRNYGWRVREGLHCFDPAHPGEPPPDCPRTGGLGEPLIDPVLEVPNSDNPFARGATVVVIGGFVYRGLSVPGLQGFYVFGGFTRRQGRPDGSVFAASPVASDSLSWTWQELQVRPRGDTNPRATIGRLGRYIKGFGQDDAGEIYICATDSAGPSGSSGRIYLLEPAVRRSAVEVAPGSTRSAVVAAASGEPLEIRFALEEAGAVEVAVYDASGRLLRLLARGPMERGAHALAWDRRDAAGTTVPSGVYFIRVARKAGVETRQLVLVQ